MKQTSHLVDDNSSTPTSTKRSVKGKGLKSHESENMGTPASTLSSSTAQQNIQDASFEHLTCQIFM